MKPKKVHKSAAPHLPNIPTQKSPSINFQKPHPAINSCRSIINTAVAMILAAISVPENSDIPPSETISLRQPYQHLASTPDTISTQEKITDEVISRAESGFKQFQNLTAPLIQSISDETLKQNLLSPFIVMDLNNTNPHKNLPRFRKQAIEKGITRYEETGASQYIFYYLAKEKMNSAGAYDVVSKTISLPTDFNPNSLHDMLVLFHELKHVIQDTNARINCKSHQEFEEYLAFYNDPNSINIFINNEIDAYAYEIELLNLLMNGELMNAAQEKREINNKILNTITQNPAEIARMKLTLNLSQLYFPDRITSILQNPENHPFVVKLIELYSQSRYKIWIKTAEGESIEYPLPTK